MKFVLLLTAALMFVGCTPKQQNDAGCTAQKAIVNVVASTLAAQLDCKGVDAMKAAIDAQAAKLNVCKPAEPTTTLAGTVVAQSVVGAVICGPLVEGLFSGALTKVPADWQCSGGALATDAKAKLIEACAKAI